MKENKYGILVSLFLTILSLLGAIFLNRSTWWQTFSFSILGGSLCSLIIFIFNYFVQMKKVLKISSLEFTKLIDLDS